MNTFGKWRKTCKRSKINTGNTGDRRHTSEWYECLNKSQWV